MQIRHFLIAEFFQLFRQSFVTFFFTVFGQVAGNEKHIGIILFDRFQHGGQERIAFRKHFAVAVEMLCEILGVFNHCRG